MTVREFFGTFADCRCYRVELTDYTTNGEISGKVARDEEENLILNLPEDWKNSEIICWCMGKDNESFIMDVQKEQSGKYIFANYGDKIIVRRTI